MKLYFYNEHLQKEIDEYEIKEEQLRFTTSPKEVTLLVKEDPDRFGILAMVDEKLVTYFNLHKNEGVKPYSDNPHAILLRAFSTNQRYVGKGYAKQALKVLPSFVKEHFPEIDEIVLAVNLNNDVAQNLYRKSGFVDEGVRRMGVKGELIVMSYYL